MIKNLHFLLFIMLMPIIASAQTDNGQNIDRAKIDMIGQTFLTDKLEELDLTDSDILGMHISDLYVNNHNGWTHLYYTQTYKDVQVRNAILNLTIKSNGEVLHYGNRFVKDIRSKIESDAMVISASEAIIYAAEDLELPGIVPPTVLKKNLEFQKEQYTAPFADEKILVQPKYIADENGLYRLTWEVYLDEKSTPDTWFSYIDAVTGKLVSKINNTVYCQVHNGMFHNHSSECRHIKEGKQEIERSTVNTDGATYRAFPLPIESPVHGNRELLVDPAIPEVSPFGWHDVDGEPGAEFTITRGNNVWAYADKDGDDTSDGDEPDGGDDLVFDFTFDETVEPINSLEADITNLFVACNMFHDNIALVGFDSPSGNFQANDYGAGGRDNDPVRAETLDGIDQGNGNNATFGTPPDGASGQMQMFQWNFTESIFRITEPASIAGDYEVGGITGDWSIPPIDEIDVEGPMIVALDGDLQFPEQGCGEIENDIEGQVAMIFRGSCEFGTKALNAQNAGAIAVVICNVPGVRGGDGEEILNPAPGDDGINVNIPTYFMANSNCLRITNLIDQGITVTADIGLLMAGPTSRSSGYDNGVIAHEFGHGVHNRLGGGPANSGCYNNDEQMGEGVADFFTLAMTAEEGDSGTDARGIGAYVTGSTATGRGIRRFPYSTDMSVSPYTYDDIKATDAPHPVGEVWTSILWDVYWAFVDLYGFSTDWADADAGNVRAVRLAIDGMRLAPCGPGFLDMRDALFEADEGAHECMLWDIFARRGLGWNADQGSPNDRNDGVEDFEPLPTCIPTLKISKTIQELVTPGEEIEVTLVIANHTGELSINTIITDNLPDGLTYVDGSASLPATVNGNTLMLEAGDLEPLGPDDTIASGNITVTYRLQSDPNIFSITQLFNGVEPDEDNPWELDIFGAVGQNFWTRTFADANGGEASWIVREFDGDSDQRLIYPDIDVSAGERTTIRFWHRINCTPLENGGFIEYSTDGVAWLDVADRFVLGGYTDAITFDNLARPNHFGYTGNNGTGEFEAGYIDFTDINEPIDLRFRFTTYDINDEMDVIFDVDEGWFIDDFEVMDLRTYEVEATISADNADPISDGVREVIIDSNRRTVSTNDIELEGIELQLIPNPASDNVTVMINSDRNLDLNISLVSIEGRAVYNDVARVFENQNFMDLDISDLAGGFYLLQISSEGKVITEKLIIE